MAKMPENIKKTLFITNNSARIKGGETQKVMEGIQNSLAREGIPKSDLLWVMYVAKGKDSSSGPFIGAVAKISTLIQIRGEQNFLYLPIIIAKDYFASSDPEISVRRYKPTGSLKRAVAKIELSGLNLDERFITSDSIPEDI